MLTDFRYWIAFKFKQIYCHHEYYYHYNGWAHHAYPSQYYKCSKCGRIRRRRPAEKLLVWNQTIVDSQDGYIDDKYN